MKPGNIICYGLLAASFATAPAAYADSPIIVTASRLEENANRSLSAASIITREEIARSGLQDVAHILRFHAGLDIGRNGGPGQQTSLFMRGTDSNHTLVLLDGVRINPGTIGGAPLQNIEPDMIERIEIVRGPHSTLYGSDAIGGVVQIFTRQPDSETSDVEAVFGSGADDARHAGIRIASNHGKHGFSLDAHHRTTDGFPTRTTSSIENGHDSTTLNARYNISTTPLNVGVSHWQSRGTTDYLDFFLAPLSQDNQNSVTAVSLQPNLSGRWVTDIKLSHMEDDIQQNDNNDFVRTRRNILDWQNDFELNQQHLISAGIYILREKTDSLSFGTAFDESTDVDAIYLQDSMTFDRHSARLSARHTDHEGFGGNTTWGLSYGFSPSDDAFMFASAGTAFRAPDATDRFGFGGNPALDPEESLNLEIGFRKQLTEQQSVTATLFQNEIDDLIVFNDPDGFLGPLPGMNQNIEEARIRGIELGYQLDLGRFSGRLDTIIQDPENRSLDRQLARRAKRTLTAAVDYEADSYTVGADLIVTSERPDSDFSTTMLGGYGLLNLNFSKPLGKSISVRGSIENVFDKEYALADGFNVQDRAAFLSVRITN